MIAGLPVNIIQCNDAGICGANVSWTIPTATDNVPGITIASDHQSGELFPQGVTIVTYTATDVAGNTVSGSFTIRVNDSQPPTITGLSAVINAKTGVGTCAANINLGTPITADTCGIKNDTNNGSGYYPVRTPV